MPDLATSDLATSDLDAKREEIAAHFARGLGFDGLAGLSPSDRARVDRRTAEAIDGCDPASPEPVDGSGADDGMRRLLAEYRGLLQLRTDAANVRLAEAGEVFAPEDDA
ncbi:hypothetical protein FV226_17445 [Methylobacterium sp. WL12]|uniref:hypothetical protein n=1 Tax=Methylobacterium sp. WL12 TaxID=2603890 RepID=UPI0011C9D636|nr:hypothetical protein [Methylobacterium sp. WL12]TXM70122.1 hypothetical protein FV226_17445 [Methylobacterium sp. WL12]